MFNVFAATFSAHFHVPMHDGMLFFEIIEGMHDCQGHFSYDLFGEPVWKFVVEELIQARCHVFHANVEVVLKRTLITDFFLWLQAN